MDTIQARSVQRGTLFVVIASALWGTVGVASQALVNLTSTTPLTISYLRLVIAAPILLVIGWQLLGRSMWSISRRDVGLMMLIGLLTATDQVLYFAAISFTGVTIATLIAVCSAPILVILMTAALEHTMPTPFILKMVALALVGAVLLVAGSATTTHYNSSLVGVALAAGSALTHSSVLMLGKFLSGKYHALQITAIGFSTGAICLFALSHLVVSAAGNYPLTGWALILYLGVVPTALAYGLFLIGMRTTSAPVASILILLEPLTAAVLAWILFGERLLLPGIVGAGLLLGAIYALSRESR
ncbi:MAG: EamA family transporter [Chloroflexota bacterium]